MAKRSHQNPLQQLPLMHMLLPKQAREAGASPGQIRTDPDALPTRIRLIGYGPDGIGLDTEATAAEARAAVGAQSVTWINVTGLGDSAALAELGEAFAVHGLALEDIVNVHQRPKFEEYPGQDFIVLRLPGQKSVQATEQFSILLGEGWLISFFERPQDFTAALVERIHRRRPRLVEGGADYLAYALLDAATDSFYPLLESFSDQLERDEETIIASHSSSAQKIRRIHAGKRQLFVLNRLLRQIRQVYEILLDEEVSIITESTRIHLRDVHDHAGQLINLVESLQDGVSSLIALQLSLSGQRLNEVMGLLTIIATIFIPLSFIAGLYGMNFDTNSPWNLPELGWRYGYPFALGLMLAVAGVMLGYFRHRGWLGRREDD